MQSWAFLVRNVCFLFKLEKLSFTPRERDIIKGGRPHGYDLECNRERKHMKAEKWLTTKIKARRKKGVKKKVTARREKLLNKKTKHKERKG